MQEAAGERIAPRPGRCLSKAPRQHQVLPDSEFIEKLRKLERARQAASHPCFGREPRDILPAEADNTLLGNDVSGQDPEQGGLTRAIWSYEAAYGAFRHPDINLLQCFEATEIHRHLSPGKDIRPVFPQSAHWTSSSSVATADAGPPRCVPLSQAGLPLPVSLRARAAI